MTVSKTALKGKDRVNVVANSGPSLASIEAMGNQGVTIRRIMKNCVLYRLMTAFALSAEKPKPEELLQAVQLHDMVAINRLLAQGADVNAPNDAGATPLM